MVYYLLLYLKYKVFQCKYCHLEKLVPNYLMNCLVPILQLYKYSFIESNLTSIGTLTSVEIICMKVFDAKK
jgi:hypothetical protein